MAKFAGIRAWAKLIGTLAVLAGCVLVIVMNRNNRADLWFFHGFEQVPVLWLIVVTAAVSVVGWKILCGLRGAYSSVRREKTQASQDKSG